MSFTGNPGTGKTTVALRMADLLHRLGYVRKGHLVAVTRDDLVGQYIGHTAPKTKEVLKKAMGGVLFIDEAYYLYRPENERDYGQEAIEILLQVMENQRDDLVVILAGYADRMDTLLPAAIPASARASPTTSTFPTTATTSSSRSPSRCSAQQNYRFDARPRAGARATTSRCRRAQPHFANARSIRNALDRARLRQANRLFETAKGPVDADDAVDHRGRGHPGQPRLRGAQPGRKEEADHERDRRSSSRRRSCPPTSRGSARRCAAVDRGRAPTGSIST